MDPEQANIPFDQLSKIRKELEQNKESNVLNLEPANVPTLEPASVPTVIPAGTPDTNNQENKVTDPVVSATPGVILDTKPSTIKRIDDNLEKSFNVFDLQTFAVFEDKLSYIAVRPSASMLVLRQKVWHLLDLPDYCDEVIILKSGDREIPLTSLRTGNDPQHPFVLEVFLPGQTLNPPKSPNPVRTMLTMGLEPEAAGDGKNDLKLEANYSTSNDTCCLKNSGDMKKVSKHYCLTKKSSLSCNTSSTSFIKLGAKKSSFTSLLIKIQSDLNYLTNKLSNLEHRLPT